MLTQGNHKLGGRLIWSFSLPSARSDVCIGMSELCQKHCYARRMEKFRPAVLARYEANHRLSLSPDFARRVRAFLVARDIAVVRLHVGGDFYSPAYARKWLRVMRRSPQVRFYFYTRAWRDEAMRGNLERMAELPTVAPGIRATARQASLLPSRRAFEWRGCPSRRTTCLPPSLRWSSASVGCDATRPRTWAAFASAPPKTASRAPSRSPANAASRAGSRCPPPARDG